MEFYKVDYMEWVKGKGINHITAIVNKSILISLLNDEKITVRYAKKVQQRF